MKEPHHYDDTKADLLRERADAMDANAQEVPIQVMNPMGDWVDRGPIEILHPQFRYRRKPTPVARRWSKPSDVPGPVCWIRQCSTALLVVGISENGISLSQAASRTWEALDGHEHSADRVNWNPCTTLEP